MFNKIILVGNLTRDIELRYAQSGSAIANTAIATSRKFTVNGEKKEETCFVDITFFGRSGEVANQYLRKGSKILVEGRLSFEQWVDKTSGQKRSKHSVIVESMQMLDRKEDSSGYSEPASDNSSGHSDKPYQAPTPVHEDHPNKQNQEEQPLHDKQGSLPMGDDEEIPF